MRKVVYLLCILFMIGFDLNHYHQKYLENIDNEQSRALQSVKLRVRPLSRYEVQAARLFATAKSLDPRRTSSSITLLPTRLQLFFKLQEMQSTQTESVETKSEVPTLTMVELFGSNAVRDHMTKKHQIIQKIEILPSKESVIYFGALVHIDVRKQIGHMHSQYFVFEFQRKKKLWQLWTATSTSHPDPQGTFKKDTDLSKNDIIALFKGLFLNGEAKWKNKWWTLKQKDR